MLSHVYRTPVDLLPPEASTIDMLTGTTEPLLMDEALLGKSFGSSYRSGVTTCNFTYFKLSFLGQFVALASLCSTIIFVFVSAYVDTFQYEFKGFTGLYLDNKYLSYGFVNLGEAWPDVTGNPNSGPVIWTQITYFLFGLVATAIILVGFGYLWVVPLSRRTQQVYLIVIEMVNAWSCYDVFVCTLVLTYDDITLVRWRRVAIFFVLIISSLHRIIVSTH